MPICLIRKKKYDLEEYLNNVLTTIDIKVVWQRCMNNEYEAATHNRAWMKLNEE